MNIVYVSGSPRKNSNTEILLKEAMSVTGGSLIKLSEYRIEPCSACWSCLRTGDCSVRDDMRNTIVPMLLEAEGIVIGSPVFFNNVSAPVKAFMDRTWYIKGKLRNKIGGAIVVGQRYGFESAITAIHAFFLKHEMLPANRGVNGVAFDERAILEDERAIMSARNLGSRIMELGSIL
jgi:multimeric flavodoxin WrbA